MINFDFHKYVNKYVKKEDKITYLDKAKEIKARFIEDGDLAYWNKLDTYVSKEELVKIIETTKFIKANCDVFIVIGIGGSYMGAKAVIEALSPTFNRKSPEIIFLGNNLCAEEYQEVFDYIKEREVIVNVISKSGTTLENDSVAPFNSLTIFIPATAIGRSPTGVSTENLPPTLSGTVNVV